MPPFLLQQNLSTFTELPPHIETAAPRIADHSFRCIHAVAQPEPPGVGEAAALRRAEGTAADGNSEFLEKFWVRTKCKPHLVPQGVFRTCRGLENLDGRKLENQDAELLLDDDGPEPFLNTSD